MCRQMRQTTRSLGLIRKMTTTTAIAPLIVTLRDALQHRPEEEDEAKDGEEDGAVPGEGEGEGEGV